MALVVLLTFGAGLGVGVVWHGDSPAPTRTSRTSRTPAEPDRTTDEGHAAELPPAVAIEVPTGDGVFRGSVRTVDGDPLEHARVVATPTPIVRERGSTRTPAGPLQDDLLRHYIDQLRWSVATRREARTSADGTYRIEGLARRDHTVRAYHPGYDIRGTGERRSRYRPDAEVDFEARRVVRVPIEIRPPDVHNVQLRVRGDRMSTTRFWRRGYEWIELEPGTYTIQASGGNSSEFESQTETVRVTSDGAPRVVLDLSGKPGLKGRVILPDGYALERSLYVYCMPAESNDPPPAQVFRKSAKSVSVGAELWGVHAGAADDLAFLIKGLEDGLHFVGVGYGGERVDGIRLVRVRGLTQIELQVPEPDLESAVVVYAKGPEGRPLRKFGTSSSIVHPNMHVGGGDAALRTRDGGRVVRFAKWKTEEWGKLDDRARYFIDVSAKRLGKIRREVKPGGRLAVRFEKPASLLVVIEGYRESPLRDSLTVTLKRDKRPIQWWAAIDRSTGTYERKHLQPGPIMLILNRRRDLPLVERVVRLEPGANEVKLAIPVLYALEVTVPGAKTGRVWLLRDEHGRGSRPLDESGRAVFELPAGEYTVGYGKRERVTVRVPGRASVALR